MGQNATQLTLAGKRQLTLLPTFTASVGSVFGWIDNQSSLPVTGVFDGLPNGSLTTVGGWTFRINYDGKINPADVYSNDVILTVVATPDTSGNTASVNGLVWDDQNGNGLIDPAEPFAQGIAVTLTDADGNSLRTYTDVNGQYTFSNLAASDNYTVQIDPTANPTYVNDRLTLEHALPNPDGLPDSYADTITGTTSSFSLLAGQSVVNLDAGLTANAPPVGVADSYSGVRDHTLTVNSASGVLANDTDADGDSLTATLVNGPVNGTLVLNPDGSFVYTPNSGFAGIDTFTYQPAERFGPGSGMFVSLDLTHIERRMPMLLLRRMKIHRSALTCSRAGWNLHGHGRHGKDQCGAGLAGARRPYRPST